MATNRNVKHRSIKDLKKDESHKIVFTFIRKGFMDRILGIGFDPAYETWSEGAQKNYENGRHLAGECLVTGIVKTSKDAKYIWREWIMFPRSLEIPYSLYTAEINQRQPNIVD